MFKLTKNEGISLAITLAFGLITGIGDIIVKRKKDALLEADTTENETVTEN